MRIWLFTLVAIVATCSNFPATSSGKGTPPEKKKSADDVDPSDQERIKGAWKLVSGEDGGRAMPANEIALMTFVFGEGKITVQHDKESDIAKFTLDPSKQPKEIDIHPQRQPNERAVRGIYKFDGDRLIIRYSERGERPKSFDGAVPKEDGQLTLMRAK